MKINNKFASIFITILLGSAALSNAQTQEVEQQSQPQTEMVSGGIGDSGMDTIATTQKNYNLKLIFSEPDGEYLADISAVIHDKKGNTVLDTHSVGPIVLVKLKPGTYTLSSTSGKETRTSKVVVHNTGISTYYIHLNDSES